MKRNIKMKGFVLVLLLLAVAGAAKAQQWQELNTGVTEDLYDVCCIDTNTVFACGQNGVILKTTDGGENWKEKYRRTGCQMTEMCFADSNIGYAVCDSTIDIYSHQWFLMKTCNGGETWIEMGSPVFSWIESYTALGNQFIRTELFLIDADNLVVAVSFDGIYKSTDGGLTIRRITNDFTINETRGMFFEDNVGYLIWNYGEEDLAFPGERYAGGAKTENHGETWERLEDISDMTNGIAFAHFYDKDHIRLFGSFKISEFDYRGILETCDGFDSFEAIGNSFGYMQFVEEYIRAKFTKNGWGMSMLWGEDMPGVGRNVSYTKDDGLTWTSYSGYGLPTYRFYDIDGIDSTFYISSANGIVLKNRQFTLMGIDEQTALSVSVYPNPVTNELVICGKENSDLILYDCSGRVLLQQKTTDEIQKVEIGGFPSGIYLLGITDSTGRVSFQKILKE